MSDKKAQINQVFVYIMSIILILFVGFLVTKFVITFSGDVEERADSKLFNDLQKDFDSVYRTYGSEKVLDYRITSDKVCFVQESSCINSISNLDANQKQELSAVFDGGDNVVLFDDVGIVNSANLGDFIVKDSGCKCFDVDSGGVFTVVIQNNKNDVYIFEE